MSITKLLSAVLVPFQTHAVAKHTRLAILLTGMLSGCGAQEVRSTTTETRTVPPTTTAAAAPTDPELEAEPTSAGEGTAARAENTAPLITAADGGPLICEGPTPTFESMEMNLTIGRCASCHSTTTGNETGLDVTDLTSVREQALRMLSAMRHEPGFSKMPRNTSIFGSDEEAEAQAGFPVWTRLPDEQVDIFACWIQAGGPES